MRPMLRLTRTRSQRPKVGAQAVAGGTRGRSFGGFGSRDSAHLLTVKFTRTRRYQRARCGSLLSMEASKVLSGIPVTLYRHSGPEAQVEKLPAQTTTDAGSVVGEDGDWPRRVSGHDQSLWL